MTLRPFRLPCIVLLVVVADMLRDIPHELAKLAGAILIVVALLIMERTAYKRGIRDAEADHARRSPILPPDPSWFRDLGYSEPKQ